MEFIQQHFATIITAFFGAGGLGAWFFERRQRIAKSRLVEANADGDMIKNAGALIDLYKKELDDLEARYTKKFSEFEEMSNQRLKLINDEIKMHKRLIASLKKENTELRRQLKHATEK